MTIEVLELVSGRTVEVDVKLGRARVVEVDGAAGAWHTIPGKESDVNLYQRVVDLLVAGLDLAFPGDLVEPHKGGVRVWFGDGTGINVEFRIREISSDN